MNLAHENHGSGGVQRRSRFEIAVGELARIDDVQTVDVRFRR